MKRLEVRAALDSLPVVQDFVTRDVRRLSPSVDLAQDIQLVLEEVFTNIVFYGRSGAEATVEISCSRGSDGLYTVELKDSGVPFNPLALEEPDLGKDFSDREIGGLGIHLVKSLVHAMDYRREGERNALTLRFRIE